MKTSLTSRLAAIEDRLAPGPEQSDWEKYRHRYVGILGTDKAALATDFRRWGAVAETEGFSDAQALIELLDRNSSRLLGEAADEAGDTELGDYLRRVGGVNVGEALEPMPPLPQWLTGQAVPHHRLEGN